MLAYLGKLAQACICHIVIGGGSVQTGADKDGWMAWLMKDGTQ
jgi:hypothetical protein